jgi:pimeloyl-ACP methyl ester carboxylesterase
MKMEEFVQSGYAPVNGLNMYYEIHGNGEMPLVLIHGGGSTLESSFGNILPLLCKSRKVIGLELQAHGHTGDRDTDESFEQDALDVLGLLEYLQINKADIMGFSDGGCTTIQMAISYPDIVHKTVIVSANYKREGMVPGFFEGLSKASLSDMPDVLKRAYLKVAPDKNHLQTMFDKDVARRLNFKDWTDDDIRSIKSNALLMASDRDVITLEHTAKLFQVWPFARLVVLPGSHGAFIGAAESYSSTSRSILPTITTALVEEFLNEPEAKG